MEWKHPTGNVPHAVAILALGTSRVDWDTARLVKGVETLKAEVWVVNRGLRLWQHDLAFVMDDLRREAAEDPDYGRSILEHDRPVITSKLYPEWGDHVLALPLREMAAWAVRNHLRPYWCNSIPIMIAYAAFIGAREIYIHGADYTDQHGRVMEAGRSNVEYWIGACEAMGVEVGISPNGRLLGHADYPPGYVYGYDLQWEARQIVSDGVQLGRTPQGAEEQIDPDPAPPAAEPTPTPEDPPPDSGQWTNSYGRPLALADAPRNELGLVMAYCAECKARYPRHMRDCSLAGPPQGDQAG